MKLFNRIAFGIVFFLLAIMVLNSCSNFIPQDATITTKTSTSTTTSTITQPTVAFHADWDNERYYDKVQKKYFPVPDKEYTGFLVSALKEHGSALLNRTSIKDANTFCPKYSSLSNDEKIQFYLTLFSTMARWESGFYAKNFYREDFKDPSGNVISRGLLQMSQISANANRYKCGIKVAEDLYDPKINLVCAVKIMSSLVGEDEYIGTALGAGEKSDHKGGSRYWSVLRTYVYDSKTKAWKIRPAKVDITTKTKKVKGCV